MKKFMSMLALIATQAQAVCLPANVGGTGSTYVRGDNPRGCGVGWWCPDPAQPLYIAAAKRRICDASITKLATDIWLKTPDVDSLTFGQDPFTYPTLLAIWNTPEERAKLDAVRPK